VVSMGRCSGRSWWNIAICVRSLIINDGLNGRSRKKVWKITESRSRDVA
jgi:hypothetical protein